MKQEAIAIAELRAREARTMTEKTFQAHIIQRAKDSGWMVYHTWRSIHSAAGFPDLVLVRDTRIYYAEIKTERGKLTPGQTAWRDALRLAGQETHVWRPSMWREIVEILEGTK